MTYWERRQRELNQALEKDEMKLKKRLSSFYDAEYRKLEKEIAAYYSQYGENNVIAYRRLMESLPEEDKRLLLERMDGFAEKYPEYAHLLPVRESIYKLNRLEGLQQSILLQQLEIGSVNEEEIRKHLEKQAARNASAAAETMGFGKNFYAENSQLVRQVVNTAWCNGKNFSQRIWDNVEKLAGYLGTDLAQGFARGDSYERLTKQLRQRFGKVSRNDAYRLIYTEGTFVMNEARAASFEQDTEEYVFRVQYDAIRRNGWQDVCDDLNGKTFQWSERKPGINFPPMHAWCHCTATPYVSDWNAWMDRYVQRHGSGQAEKVEKRLESDIIMYRKGSTHRKTSADGRKIIDKATYYKITNPAIKKGADIRIADGEILRRLQKEQATAVTYGNVLFFRPDATVSDVLEEVHHFYQNKRGLNSQYGARQRIIMNEIDAKNYLLSVVDKYHIPEEETALTKSQLESYKAEMEKMKTKGEWVDES